MLKVMCYSFLCQLLKALFFSWYIRGITILYVLVFILASHICILNYLLKHLFSKASLLILLFLFLKMLPLYFLSLLGLFMLKVAYYNSLCQLLKALFFNWYVKDITVLHILVFILAS